MSTLTPGNLSPFSPKSSPNHVKFRRNYKVCSNGFPSFLPKEVENIKDSFARNLAQRIERLPVQLTSSGTSVMSSCVRPMMQRKEADPIFLLHGFDSSCLEWRYTYPLLEEAGLESWAFDVLGWGFSDLERLPQCDVASKREHLYQFWKSYIKRPMILVGPSLGAAVAIDFAVNHPETVALLKSVPLRLYVNRIAFNDVSFSTSLDWMNIGRLHCLFPWWEDATVAFMRSGGYIVVPLIKQVKQQTLIIWGEDDQIISYKLGLELHGELEDAKFRQIPDCGHIPHVEKPSLVADLIIKFAQQKCSKLSRV
ncbi:hypothetical protein SOVF_054250 isoform A [Spinacia oleracea]|nr:hypothetical protein SOVF_054250 isoform A [Spinacia oleracea]